MLREGLEYYFRIDKELVTPDNKRHFVLISPDKRKLLLPADFYYHYNFTVGKRIRCRVDRISCKGEIYLEPRNPHYREGKSYFFVVEGIETRTDNTGNEIKVFIVTDRYGRKIAVPSGSTVSKPGKRVRLVIERISKGKLHLAPNFMSGHIITLNPDQKYEFFVERITKGLDNEDYFVIRDPYGNSHLLMRRYYEYYGLKEGESFTGKVVRYRETGQKIIEPENPFYSVGDELEMKIASTGRNVINGTFTLNLKDRFGHSHCIETDKIPAGKNVKCRVEMIKKGRLILVLL
jgi:hypothetical protein